MTPRNLTPASGRQDHTTLPSASASFVRALFARLTLPRPPHPAPNVRDDRETPLCVGRDGGVLELIWVGGEAEYFSRRGWTGKSVICPSGNHAFTYGPARGAYSSISPRAKVRYAAHFGLNADTEVGPRSAITGLV